MNRISQQTEMPGDIPGIFLSTIRSTDVFEIGINLSVLKGIKQEHVEKLSSYYLMSVNRRY